MITTGILLLECPSSQGSDQIVHVLELGSSRRALHVCPVGANCSRERLGRTVPFLYGAKIDAGGGGRDWEMTSTAMGGRPDNVPQQLCSQETQVAVPCCGC